MVRKQKDIKTSTPKQKVLDNADNTRLKLALKTSLNNPTTRPSDLTHTDQQLTQSFDLMKKEVECARLFNFELPEDIILAVELLENAVAKFTDTRKNVILYLDETTGTYSCLNDEKYPDQKPRELTQISDGFLQELLETDQVLHTYLFSQDALIGIIAVAEREDNQSLGVRDEMTLEMVASYLSTKIQGFKSLKQSLMLSVVQRTVLEISSQLITAVDQEGVLATTLESFGRQLGFGICQYIHTNADNGLGEVLLEYQDGKTKSFVHAGLKSKRKSIPEFSAMISLFSSAARSNPYLHIPGNQLGDRHLQDIFGISKLGKKPQIHAALILPVIDPATGKIRGTFNLYRTVPYHVGPETLEMAKEIISLVSLALSRVMVLEMALEMASTDELTGLTNRRGLYDRFEAEIERARRNQTSLSVAMIDVDHFKKFNDTYGHLNGDVVLRELAQIFTHSLRKSDLVCRFGGEEFSILLPDTSFKAATDLLERIREKVSQALINGIDDEEMKASISVGLAQVNTTQNLSQPSRDLISESLALADEQLYLAKEQGRNKVCATCTKENSK